MTKRLKIKKQKKRYGRMKKQQKKKKKIEKSNGGLAMLYERNGQKQKQTVNEKYCDNEKAEQSEDSKDIQFEDFFVLKNTERTRDIIISNNCQREIEGVRE